MRAGFACGQDDGTLFLTTLGEAFVPNRMTQLVRDYVDAADIGKRGSCHLFRHTMATRMLENGADIRFIQAMLGHAELSTTQIYTQVSIRMLKQFHAATHPGRPIAAGARTEPEFDRRVKAAFPVGVSEQQAVSSLKEAGFKITPAGSDGYASADLKRGNMVCQTIWSVRWKADAGAIREIFGVYGHRCP